ncbi:MAG: ABC transporter permease subunit [Gammaproteobacteria bacterium]
MSPWRVVLNKEFLEGLRDRRTLMAALLFGPLFGPLLFGGMISLILGGSIERSRASVELPVIGLERAPHLSERLVEAALDPAPFAGSVEDARRAVERGDEKLVLHVPQDFGQRLRAGEPARLELVRDSSDRETSEAANRVEAAVEGWSREISALRMAARGIAPELLYPMVMQEIDVATPASRAVLMLGMVTYFLIFATLMGGLYLAIDTTAGERERGSLEPLLALPVRRDALIAGKLGATIAFMLIACAICILAFAVSLRFVPFAELGIRPNTGPLVLVQMFLLMIPFACLGAALLMFVASFTRSYREAQSWLSVVLLIPTIPIAFAGLKGMGPSLPAMLVPSLSQHLLITEVFKGGRLDPLFVAVSAASSLAAAGLLVLAIRARYRRESILGTS